VKRALAWFAGLVGIAALGRWLAARRRRPETVTEQVPGPAPAASTADDPAAELRRKLAASRQAEETDVRSGEGGAEETLDERRARIHAKAREAIDAMSDETAT
jgi:hypothetical protein